MRYLSVGAFIVLFLCSLSGFSGKVMAQSDIGASHMVDSNIDFKGHTVDGRFVKISYEIPFNGMVEFRLYDRNGEKVWQNQYVNYQGKNSIVLKASKFTPGEQYTYAINYKTDEVKNTLVVPPSGFVE